MPSPFAFDPDEAVRYLRGKDPALARLMDTVGPFRMELKTTSSLFGALAEAIVYQQLTGKAAATIFGRVRGLFPRAHEAPTADQIHEVAEDRLREAGLSRAKPLALKDLARRAQEGTLPTLAETQAMDDDATAADACGRCGRLHGGCRRAPGSRSRATRRCGWSAGCGGRGRRRRYHRESR